MAKAPAKPVLMRLTTSRLGVVRDRIVRVPAERAPALEQAAHAVRASDAEVAAFEADGRWPIQDLA